jgi:hypothetical protein
MVALLLTGCLYVNTPPFVISFTASSEQRGELVPLRTFVSHTSIVVMTVHTLSNQITMSWVL